MWLINILRIYLNEHDYTFSNRIKYKNDIELNQWKTNKIKINLNYDDSDFKWFVVHFISNLLFSTITKQYAIN